MIDWQRTSERHLVYHICKTPTRDSNTQAYQELRQRLNRYFSKEVYSDYWQKILTEHRQEIIAETIMVLAHYYPQFKGNSRQYRKYICKVFHTTCINYLEKEAFMESLDTSLFNQGDTAKTATLLDLLANQPTAFSRNWSIHYDAVSLIPPEEYFAYQEQTNLLQTTRSQLTKQCQKLLHHEVDLEQPQKEIAHTLNLSHTAVRGALRRCRQDFLRQLIHNLANGPTGWNPDKVQTIIQQLPAPYDIILGQWWAGQTSWRKLGQLLNPPQSQKDIKTTFTHGLLRLFAQLNEGNQND